jgi:acyl-CoA thioester hydrolase
MTPAFSIPVRVYYEDTDAGGVVYYANYLKFLERARTEWLRTLGFEQDELARDERVLFAVRDVNAEFVKPARFNELLRATAALERLGRASLRFAQTVERDGALLVRAAVTVACLDADGFRPCPLPARLRQTLESHRTA